MEINPNSHQPTGSNSPSPTLGNIQRPGEYLRQIRIAQKKELEEIANVLNMPVKTLTALEQDDYKSLPEATFIKGYYRAYAKCLNADASAIIQRFDEIYANDTGLKASHALSNSPIKTMGKLTGSKSVRNRQWLKRIVILAVVLLLAWLAVIAVQNWTSSHKDDADVPKIKNSEVEILPMGNAIATSGDQLVLSFSRPTSVHIVDATGKVLATGRQASTLNLSGESPFQIRLDDATAVALTLNQEQISLSPYTVNGKAEFRLSR
ncbi:helix-turn-helix domain-containing protein [Acinetobacter venetianus]|uniref:helix-turn-helix domain-containing protein n=1 Tax=Acinetobacter venetianus TaxID=52133 RepID=UPI0007787B25|nr:helix-turn-helix domain-containing protein [Acinetobacter venetianus]KXZ64896.1 Cytoskeleton protein RodZ [Acinetobacter venetianus]